jgi:dihydrofolate synthase/folylpolyglutamate synthase
MPALERLLNRRPAHRILWGLERTTAMLRSLGDPQGAFESVHVGGTNGKGSTAALIESSLRQSGRVTGLYTSPHLCEFAERIRIRGVPAERGLLEDCARDVFVVAEREDASFFEATTVLAFEVFRRSGCETVVAEVGLGGRLDATNVLEPRVSVITSIDLDHSNYLGDTLEAIAAEKAGILKPGVPSVAGLIADGPLGVLTARATALGSPLDVFGRDLSVDHVSTDLAGTRFLYRSGGWADGLPVRIPLVGEHQARNAAVAIRALERFESAVFREDIVSGMGSAVWPGRFEVRSSRGGTWVLDIAHNPQAVATLAAMLEALDLPRPLVLLLSILGDKPWTEMIEPLLDKVSAAVFTIAPSAPAERRWNLEEALRAAQGWRVEVDSDFEAAMTRARELAGVGTVVVTGSAHTVGDARRLILRETEME